MDSTFSRWADRLDPVAIWSGRAACWLLAPMVLSLVWEVVARYAFNAPTIWAYDMTFILYGSFFMLGGAFTLQRKGHVRTDSYYGNWSPRTQAAVDLGGYLLLFAPLALVFVFVGWGYFVKAFVTRETFVTSAWQPITWPFKLMVPLSGALLLVQGLAEVLRCLHALKHGQWPAAAAAAAESPAP